MTAVKYLTGTGASKKIAKKNAATALIQSIESVGCSLNTQVDSEVVVAHDLVIALSLIVCYICISM